MILKKGGSYIFVCFCIYLYFLVPNIHKMVSNGYDFVIIEPDY